MVDFLRGIFGGAASPKINLETASPAYRYFHEVFIREEWDVRDGFDFERIAGMTDEERAAAEPILLKSLKRTRTRDQAIMALGALKTKAAADPIRSMLKGAGKKELFVKIQTALALYQIEGNEGDFQIIKDIFQDPQNDKDARMEAVSALGKIKTPAAKAVLLEVFANDPEYLVRYNAARWYMIAQGIHFMEASNRVSEFMPFLRNPANLSPEECAATLEKLRNISVG